MMRTVNHGTQFIGWSPGLRGGDWIGPFAIAFRMRRGVDRIASHTGDVRAVRRPA